MALYSVRLGILVLLMLGAGTCGAVNLSYSLTCSPLNIGPDVVQVISQSGTVNVTPGVPTAALFSFNEANNTLNDTATGTFTGAIPCSLTIGGVTTAVNRVVTLLAGVAAPDCAQPGPFRVHCFRVADVSLTINLGAQGTLAFNEVAGGTIGAMFFANGQTGFLQIVPGTNATLLLSVPPPATPVPPSLILALTGLAGAGLFAAKRRFKRRQRDSGLL